MAIPFLDRRGTGRKFSAALAALLTTISFAVAGECQSRDAVGHYQKDGLGFSYESSWELNDQSNPTAQQLVLLEKSQDAQIMIIVLRSALTDAKQEEQAKAGLIERSIARLLKQYEDAGIKVERSPLKVDMNGVLAEGAQLRFAVDGQPGMTDVCWLVINQRLVQLFFIRPEKTAAKATACWDMVRNSLKVEMTGKTKQ